MACPDDRAVLSLGFTAHIQMRTVKSGGLHHTAHTTHAAHIRHAVAVRCCRFVRNHRFGRDQQACNRCSILENSKGPLLLIMLFQIDCVVRRLDVSDTYWPAVIWNEGNALAFEPEL